MHKGMDRFKPGVDKRVLLLLAGLLWIGVGTALLRVSFSWLRTAHTDVFSPFTAVGLVLALLIHHFGFLRIVDRNLGRLLPMEGKRCLFSFLSWKNYLMVAVMIGMGTLLRHSPIPRPYLSVLYMGIGGALVLSSIRYLRVLLVGL